MDLCVKACLKTGDNLTLIGGGPEHENLIRLANGASNIHFLPTMPQSQVAKHLAMADAFLFPSLEPFGLAPIEAMAAGIPVLAYAEGGAKDYVVKNTNGLFFDRQTVNAIAETMEKFQKSKLCSKSAATRKAIQDSVSQFDKKIFKQKIKELVDEDLK